MEEKEIKNAAYNHALRQWPEPFHGGPAMQTVNDFIKGANWAIEETDNETLISELKQANEHIKDLESEIRSLERQIRH